MGCDQAPIDLTNPDSALKLRSYVWPDASERMGRVDAAIELARQSPPQVVRQDAGDFVVEMLRAPQESGVTRVLYHSIVWQYIPDATQAAITSAMELAAADATPERPLAWVKLETNRKTFRHELRFRYWPGGEQEALLACAHPHGAWVEWLDR